MNREYQDIADFTLPFRQKIQSWPNCFRYYKILTEKKIQCLLLELLRTALSNKQITKGKYKVSSKYKDKDLLVALLFLIYDREVSM